MKINLKKSSAITSADYSIRDKKLTLIFSSSDKKYDYFDVPARVVLELKQAESVGRYYNKVIRPFYAIKEFK